MELLLLVSKCGYVLQFRRWFFTLRPWGDVIPGQEPPCHTACCCKYARNVGPNLYQVGPRVGERFPFAFDCKLHKQRVEACLRNTSSAQKVPKGQTTINNARGRASPQPFLPTRTSRGTCNALPDNMQTRFGRAANNSGR